MPANKAKKRDGSHLHLPEDLSIYEVALLKASAYDAPLRIDTPKRLTVTCVRGLIAKGLLERDPSTALRNYTIRRTHLGDLWLREALKLLEYKNA